MIIDNASFHDFPCHIYYVLLCYQHLPSCYSVWYVSFFKDIFQRIHFLYQSCGVIQHVLSKLFRKPYKCAIKLFLSSYIWTRNPWTSYSNNRLLFLSYQTYHIAQVHIPLLFQLLSDTGLVVCQAPREPIKVGFVDIVWSYWKSLGILHFIP